MSGKNKKDDKESTKESTEKVTVEKTEIPQEVVQKPAPKVDKQTLIPAKLFIKNLKVKLAKEKVSESIYIAFLSSVEKVDTEANYQKTWDTTFKRK